MFERTLILCLMVMLASCVPPAAARHAQPVAEAMSLDELRDVPVARVPEIIDLATAPGAAAAPFEGGLDRTGRGLDCLTAAVYYEARSESRDGQRAVAQVVLNRVRHAAFPGSICGVVFQGSQRATGCQFSFTCDGAMRRARDPGAWARAREVAEGALAGQVYAPVGLATHFHTTAIRPWWAASMRHAVTVGSHIFYRWPGRWGDPNAFSQSYAGSEGGIVVPSGGAVAARSEVVMGVAVHRGAPGQVMPAQVVSAQVVSASSGPRMPVARLVRDDGAYGVRVHRGGAAPVETAEAPVAVHRGEPAAETR